MITREELEKMIENGKTVWTTYYHRRIEHIDLDKLKINNYELNDDDLSIYGYRCCCEVCDRIPLDNIFATKEEAEWVVNKHVTREERFEPPHWSDISKLEFSSYNFTIRGQYHRGQILVISDRILVEYGCDCLKLEPFGEPTQENYEKAVDFARKLFLGKIEK